MPNPTSQSFAPPDAPPSAVLEQALNAHSANKLPEAERLYRTYLAKIPKDPRALHNLGVIGLQTGHADAAISLIRRSLEIDNTSADVHCNLGLALKQAGHNFAAEQAYRSAISIDPTFADAYSNLGVVLKDMNRSEEAHAVLGTAVVLAPDNCAALANLGLLELKMSRPEQALQHLFAAAKLEPENTVVLSNLGGLLAERNRYREAIKYLEKAFSLEQSEAHIPFNLGRCYFDSGQIERAISCYRAAINIDYGFASAHHNLGHALLAIGMLSEGWQEYKWRWQSPHYHDTRKIPNVPVWCRESLEEKRLLIWSEQGVGDKLLFASLVPEVFEFGGHIVLETELRLVPLFQKAFPQIEVISEMQGSETYDYQIPLGDLPSLFRNSAASFRPTAPYLNPDTNLVKYLRSKYRKGNEKLVGISWSSRPPKGIALNEFSPLFQMPGFKFINLQYGDCSTEIQTFEKKFGYQLLTDEEINPLLNIDKFVAQVASMNAVVTVQNSTLYAAGGLGIPTFAIVPPVPEWRWLGNKEKSPWHKGVWLYHRPRQPEEQGLRRTISKIREDLSHLMVGNQGIVGL